MNKILLLILGILAVGMLGGCSTDTSVKTYLQALLDASYKNDSTAFVKMKLGTEEDAQALYERGIDTGVSVFCGKIGASDDYKEAFRATYMDMLCKVRYTVDEASKQSDGSYIVTVSYEKMNVFKPALELHQNNVAAMTEEWAKTPESAPSKEDMVKEVILEFKNSMEAVLADVQYSEAQTMSIKIELANNIYTPNADDIATLEKALFDGE
ncbi:MAG: hypothetical protein K2N73_06700 [Lachnospiraceae bacterium]|nr:hypothetical protein [Lachnospiraceae bacterium]